MKLTFDSGEESYAPLVAIALPVYNGADHLEQALASFRAQTFQDFELVICDNCSTDSTSVVARKFSSADRRFKYCPQTEFVNAKDNFIRAYSMTNRRAKYFLWACDDNVWSSEFLSRTVEYMEGHPESSLCGFFVHHFEGADPAVATAKVYHPVPKAYKRWRLLNFALERFQGASIYGLMRRSAVDRIRLNFDITDYFDRYYLIQLRGLGTIHVVEEDLLAFRGGGISSTNDDPWVRTVIDLNFGEREISALFSLDHITGLEKFVLAQKFTFMALRHNIPLTARRWWLWPAYALAAVQNRLKPSRWGVYDGRLKRGA